MAIVYLRDTTSDLSGGADFNYEINNTTATLGTLDVSIAASATETSYCFSPANRPGDGTWGTGTFTVEIDVTSGNAKVDCTITVNRISSDGATVHTSASDSTPQGLNPSGVYTFTTSSTDWDAASTSSTDRIRVDIILQNTNTMGSSSVTLGFNTTDSEVTMPAGITWTTPSEFGETYRELYINAIYKGGQTRQLYVEGESLGSDYRELYLLGDEVNYQYRELYIIAKELDEIFRELYLDGVEFDSSSRELYLTAATVSYQYREIYLNSQEVDSQSRELYINGIEVGSAARDLFTEGFGAKYYFNDIRIDSTDTWSGSTSFNTEVNIPGSGTVGYPFFVGNTLSRYWASNIASPNTATWGRGRVIISVRVGSVSGPTGLTMYTRTNRVNTDNTSVIKTGSVTDTQSISANNTYIFISGVEDWDSGGGSATDRFRTEITITKTDGNGTVNVNTGTANSYIATATEDFPISDNVSRGLYINGASAQELAEIDKELYIQGLEQGSASRGVFVNGLETDEQAREIYIASRGLDYQSRELYSLGQETFSVTRELTLEGSFITSNPAYRDLYIQGLSYGAALRQFYLDSSETDYAERGLYLPAIEVGSNTRSIYIEGSLPVNNPAYRDLYIQGLAYGTQIRTLYIDGFETDFQYREVYTLGQAQGSISNLLFINGLEYDSQYRELYLNVLAEEYGAIVRDLHISGLGRGSANREIRIYGSYVGSVIREIYISGVLSGLKGGGIMNSLERKRGPKIIFHTKKATIVPLD